MSAIKYYNTTTGTWDYLSQGAKGEKGSTGTTGPTGPQGTSGVVAQATAPTDTTVAWLDTSVSGLYGGIPSGGATNQVLAKGSSTDYDTKWTSAATGTVSSVTVSAPLTGGVITSSGTIGIDQTALTIAPSQVTGTAVVTSDSRLSDTRTPTDASVTDAKILSTLSASKITNTAAVLNAANTFSVGGQSITAQSTAVKGLTVKAASSATSSTANIVEIQDSGGNALSFFRGDGVLQNQVDVRSPSFNSTSNKFSLLNINSGGCIQLSKATAGSSPGTTDYARIMLVAGTTTGTLKLVIRGGSSAVDTVIVDNIPQ